jgi:hypothetical protein
MTIDPNIIAGLRNAPVSMPDPMEQYAKSLSLKNLMQQGDAQNQARQRQASLQALLATNPNEEALRRGGFLDESLKVGKEGRERAKLDAETGKITADTAKTEQDARIGKIQHTSSVMSTAKDQNSWDMARRVLSVTFPGIEKNLPEQFDPGFVQAKIAEGQTITQRLTDERSREQLKETARGHDITSRGQNMTAATARRGQDMTDTRQREANAVSAATAALKQRELEGTLAGKDASHEQAMSSYDTAIGTLDRMVGSLDRKPGEKDYKAPHPGFEAAVGAGLQKSVLPFMGPTPGTSRAGFMRELETFKAQTFLPMVQQLKGMGALSDAEGSKLSAAVGALSEDMPEKEFKESVRLIKADLQAAKDRASRARSKPTTGGKKIGGVLTQNEDGTFNYGF